MCPCCLSFDGVTVNRYPCLDLLNLVCSVSYHGACTGDVQKGPRPVNLRDPHHPTLAMTMSPGAIIPSDSLPQPLQFKGEIMDFELAGMEVDHRKR